MQERGLLVCVGGSGVGGEPGLFCERRPPGERGREDEEQTPTGGERGISPSISPCSCSLQSVLSREEGLERRWPAVGKDFAAQSQVFLNPEAEVVEKAGAMKSTQPGI